MDNLIDKIRKMSTKDLALLGLSNVAYVKPIGISNGVQYAIHAADGTTIAIMPDLESALITLQENDLEPHSVH